MITKVLLYRYKKKNNKKNGGINKKIFSLKIKKILIKMIIITKLKH